jgi:hypothetical protein
MLFGTTDSGQWGNSKKSPDGKLVNQFVKNRFDGIGLGVDSFTADELTRDWKKHRNRINTKYILIVMLNENWGLLSCAFPARTAGNTSTMLCYAVLCCAMLCYAVLCCAML